MGVIVGGPYEGKKMVGSSLVVDSDGPVIEGEINEVAGRLTTVDITLTDQPLRGTDLGEALKQRGFAFETLDPPPRRR